MMDIEEVMVYIPYKRKGNLIVNTLGHPIPDIVRFSALSYRTNTIFSALGFSLLVAQVFPLEEKRRKGREAGQGEGKRKPASEGKNLFSFYICLVGIVSSLWFF